MFDVAPQPDWSDVVWSSKMVWRAIRDFEGAVRNRLGSSASGATHLPHILPLLGLLKALPST
jgi:hypothetical protein